MTRRKAGEEILHIRLEQIVKYHYSSVKHIHEIKAFTGEHSPYRATYTEHVGQSEKSSSCAPMIMDLDEVVNYVAWKISKISSCCKDAALSFKKDTEGLSGKIITKLKAENQYA